MGELNYFTVLTSVYWILVIDELSKEEFSCPNKELIRLVIMYVYIQERFELCTIKELHTKLVKSSVRTKKKWFMKP
jgi:DNA replication protein DnaC